MYLPIGEEGTVSNLAIPQYHPAMFEGGWSEGRVAHWKSWHSSAAACSPVASHAEGTFQGFTQSALDETFPALARINPKAPSALGQAVLGAVFELAPPAVSVWASAISVHPRMYPPSASVLG